MCFTRMKFVVKSDAEAQALQEYLNTLGYFWNSDYNKKGHFRHLQNRFFYTGEDGHITCGDTRDYFERQTHLRQEVVFEQKLVVTSLKCGSIVVDGRELTKAEALAYIEENF